MEGGSGMRYLTDCSDRTSDKVSNSAFIYHLRPPYLCCAMISVVTRHDQELREKERDYSFRFGDLDFQVLNKTFILRQNPRRLPTKDSLIQKLQEIKENRRRLCWDCIELENIEELNPTVELHFDNYVKGIYQRMFPEEFPEEEL